MTYEEKIKNIAKEVTHMYFYGDCIDAEMTINAFCDKLLCDNELKESYNHLMKKKPDISTLNDYICPSCGSFNIKSEDGYYKHDCCADCGQAIDWSFEE